MTIEHCLNIFTEPAVIICYTFLALVDILTLVMNVVSKYNITFAHVKFKWKRFYIYQRYRKQLQIDNEQTAVHVD